jgi:hypothetical protein
VGIPQIFDVRLSVFPRLSFSKTRRTPNCGPSGERFAMMRKQIPRNRAELTTKSEPFKIRISHPGREIQFSCENLLLAGGPARYPTLSEADRGKGVHGKRVKS